MGAGRLAGGAWAAAAWRSAAHRASRPRHLLLPARRQLAYAAGATAAQYKPPVVVGKREQGEHLEGQVLATGACMKCLK